MPAPELRLAEAPEAISSGCFETLRAYEGRLFRLDDHMGRLAASAQSVGIRLPATQRHLGRQLTRALRRSGLREAIVRVALIPLPAGAPEAHAARRQSLAATPTGGGIIPRSRAVVHASIVVQQVVLPPASAYREGIAVSVVPTRKFPVGVINPEVKYSARLGSVLALMDAHLRGVDEALFLDPTGSVTESTASNFGIIRGGAFLTPPCWLGLLAGITREVLLELAKHLRLPVGEVPLTRHDVYNADEAFLLSTIKEVLPVTRIDGRLIGSGRPGPVTRRLHRAFRELVRRELQLTGARL